ncbi:hypothetical protein D3C72_2401290 [compost metagenome]
MYFWGQELVLGAQARRHVPTGEGPSWPPALEAAAHATGLPLLQQPAGRYADFVARVLRLREGTAPLR